MTAHTPALLATVHHDSLMAQIVLGYQYAALLRAFELATMVRLHGRPYIGTERATFDGAACDCFDRADYLTTAPQGAGVL
jgi:hypothetical protein